MFLFFPHCNNQQDSVDSDRAGFSRKSSFEELNGKGEAQASVSLAQGVAPCIGVQQGKRTPVERNGLAHCQPFHRSLISRRSKLYRLYFRRTTGGRTIEHTPPAYAPSAIASHSPVSHFREGAGSRGSNCALALLSPTRAKPFRSSLAATPHALPFSFFCTPRGNLLPQSIPAAQESPLRALVNYPISR